MTPTVSYLLDDATLYRVFEWHAAGWWCDPEDLLTEDDQEANERVLADRSDGGPCGEVLSKYQVTNRVGNTVDIYVITTLAGQATYTVVCLPEER